MNSSGLHSWGGYWLLPGYDHLTSAAPGRCVGRPRVGPIIAALDPGRDGVTLGLTGVWRTESPLKRLTLAHGTKQTSWIPF